MPCRRTRFLKRDCTGFVAKASLYLSSVNIVVEVEIFSVIHVPKPDCLIEPGIHLHRFVESVNALVRRFN